MLDAAYNHGVLRVVPVTLLVASFLTVEVHAQRSVATFQGHAAGVGASTGLNGGNLSSGFFSHSSLGSGGFSPQRGVANGVSPDSFHHRHRQNGVLFPYFVPAYDPFWYEPSENEEAIQPAAPVIEQNDQRQSFMGEKPVPKSQIIEIPSDERATARKPLPPTIFILMSGDKVESRQFLLTASDLSIKVGRYGRTVPLEMLNVDATIAANRERGIDLRIPTDRNEISLSF
jgi:hypothetical protein